MGAEAQIGHTDRQLTIQNKTGVNEADKMKNIYDLEGNNWEWTAQAYSIDIRVGRGGRYANSNYGDYTPASAASYAGSYDTRVDYTSRETLYIGI